MESVVKNFPKKKLISHQINYDHDKNFKAIFFEVTTSGIDFESMIFVKYLIIFWYTNSIFNFFFFDALNGIVYIQDYLLLYPLDHDAKNIYRVGSLNIMSCELIQNLSVLQYKSRKTLVLSLNLKTFDVNMRMIDCSG